eukprot:TRINITY_DN8139_c0_g1_i6.p1 TRINITY_DN8139_c0_g1~~TRINITY_DN8139_c0_g1_i6.p1  ORF type:complete len:136 (-),score=12.86 TRINITY_DN8139_c0_g1_i6:131-538(-)
MMEVNLVYRVFGKLNLLLLLTFFTVDFGLYLADLYAKARKIPKNRKWLHKFMQFVSGEVYPSLIVTAISMYLYAYSCLTFALTLLMHVFFFLAYHYGYRKNHITFKLIGRMGAALCTLAIFLYSAIKFQAGINLF